MVNFRSATRLRLSRGRGVPIPNEADENERRRIREREDLVADRVSLVNRIGAVLATLGVHDYNPLRRDRRARLETLQTALGDPLPPHARARILRMLDRLDLVCAQITELEQERDAVLKEEAPDKAEKMIQQLVRLLDLIACFPSKPGACAGGID